MSLTSWKGVRSAKRLVRQGFLRMGLDIRRVRPDGTEPPPLFEDPLAALHQVRGGKPAAFACPLDAGVLFNGFTRASGGWNPFSATLEEYRDGITTTYEGSILEDYYEIWQPENLPQAMYRSDEAPDALAALPPYVILYPWSAKTAEERLEHRKHFTELENRERGFDDLKLAAGYKFQGPIDPRKGRLEFERLTAVYESLRAVGYDRSHGDTRALIIRRGDELRFLDRRGHHRRAAMKVLGYETIPTQFKLPRYVDVADVDYWPQVHEGRWDRASAVRYIDHLFDFDSRAWAGRHGLLPEQRSA